MTTSRSTPIIWSATSFNELRRDGMSAERWSLLHPTKPRRKSYLETALEGHAGPVVAATDYMRSFADQVRSQIPRRYVVLGTDGFGRSDYRVKLRKFFEVNRYYVAVAALKALGGRRRDQAGDRRPGDQEVRTRHRAARSLDRVNGAREDIRRAFLNGGDMGAVTEVKVPDIGDFKDIPIIEIMVKAGDAVKAGRPARFARVGQGDDGSAGTRRGDREGTQGQARRQGQRGQRDSAAGLRRGAASGCAGRRAEDARCPRRRRRPVRPAASPRCACRTSAISRTCR